MSDLKPIKKSTEKIIYVICAVVGIIALIWFISAMHELGPMPTVNDSANVDNEMNEDFQDDVHDWMKDRAEGKDYDYDDGGSYYCMGKGDSCNNKTRNAYDLYCSSCDPDGDNVEG